jgi:hypothetical protein
MYVGMVGLEPTNLLLPGQAAWPLAYIPIPAPASTKVRPWPAPHVVSTVEFSTISPTPPQGEGNARVEGLEPSSPELETGILAAGRHPLMEL